MRIATGILAGAFVLFAGAFAVSAQQAQTKPAAKPAAAPTIASELNTELSIVEREVVTAAEAMPEDKYSFAPTEGNFKGGGRSRKKRSTLRRRISRFTARF